MDFLIDFIIVLLPLAAVFLCALLAITLTRSRKMQALAREFGFKYITQLAGRSRLPEIYARRLEVSA